MFEDLLEQDEYVQEQLGALTEIIGLISGAPNEEMVRLILSSQPAV